MKGKGKVVIRQLGQLPGRRERARYYKKLASRTKSKGKEIILA